MLTLDRTAALWGNLRYLLSRMVCWLENLLWSDSFYHDIDSVFFVVANARLELTSSSYWIRTGEKNAVSPAKKYIFHPIYTSDDFGKVKVRRSKFFSFLLFGLRYPPFLSPFFCAPFF